MWPFKKKVTNHNTKETTTPQKENVPPLDFTTSYAPPVQQPSTEREPNFVGFPHSISYEDTELYKTLSEQQKKMADENKERKEAEMHTRLKVREDFLQTIKTENENEKAGKQKRQESDLMIAWGRVNKAPEFMNDYIQSYMQKGPLTAQDFSKIVKKIKSETTGDDASNDDTDNDDPILELVLKRTHDTDDTAQQEREPLIHEIENDERFHTLNEEAQKTWEIIKSPELSPYYGRTKMQELHKSLTNESIFADFKYIERRKASTDRAREMNSLIKNQNKSRSHQKERGGRSRGFGIER